MRVTKTIEIDAGHRVPNHKSKCKSPHGHRYVITLCVDDRVIQEKGSSDEGMVIDFSDLKEILNEKIDAVYDHSFIIHKEDSLLPMFEEMKAMGLKVNIVDFVPTAENLAKHWFKVLKVELKKRNIRISFVKVNETPSSTALFTEFDDSDESDEEDTSIKIASIGGGTLSSIDPSGGIATGTSTSEF